MPINREALVVRRDELRSKAEVLRQQFEIVKGALVDTEYWLSVYDTEGTNPAVSEPLPSSELSPVE